MATTTVYPRLFEISITLTVRAGYLKRVIDTGTVYSRLFEFPTSLTFRALRGHLLGYLKRVVMDVNHGMDNKNKSDGTHRNFRRIRLIVRHACKREK